MSINLLIVDDEQETRNGLLWYISQMNDIKFSAIHTASDGPAALRITRDFMPDILLCDIRMPNMDGFELANKLLKKNSEMRVIFISGYAVKEYLKSAINLQADGFIEKPIILDELSRILKRSVDILHRNMQEKGEYNQLSKIAAMYARHQILQALLLYPSKIDLTRKKFAKFFDSIPEYGSFSAVVFRIKWKHTSDFNIREFDLQQILQLVESDLSAVSDNKTCNTYFCGRLTSDLIGAVVRVHCGRLQDFCSGLKKICSLVQRRFKSVDSIYVAIGDTMNSLKRVSESCTMAVQAVDWLIFKESGRQIVCCGDICYVSPEDKSKQLSEKLEQLNFYAAKQLIVKQTQEIGAYELSDAKLVRNYYQKLLNVCLDFENELHGHLANEIYRKGIISIFQQLQTLSEVSRFVLSRIENMYPVKNLPANLSPKIKAAIEYIWNNISDPSLSVRSISESLGFTENYLCSLFKREVGMTLNKVILNQRIELAKRLLVGNFKLYEVAERVGFSDPNYFSTVFKKQVGMSPTDFRRYIQNNSEN